MMAGRQRERYRERSGDRPVPRRDQGCRGPTAHGSPGCRRPLPGAVGLVGRVEDPGGATMHENWIGQLIPVVGLVSALIAAYVTLKNRALLAEVRKELAE